MKHRVDTNSNNLSMSMPLPMPERVAKNHCTTNSLEAIW